MSIFVILMFGISLSMDAFAVAVCKGLAMEKASLKNCSIVGAWFGFFQGLMPFIGFFLGSLFSGFINSFDHFVTFILLGFIGANMIKESLEKSCDVGTKGGSLAFKVMLVMAIATSIDALAVGVSFAFETEFWTMLLAVTVIGITTFIVSFIGVKVGSIFGTKYKSKAEFVGGVILILLGLKFLLEGLEIINLPI